MRKKKLVPEWGKRDCLTQIMRELERLCMKSCPYYEHARAHYERRYSSQREALLLCKKVDGFDTFEAVHDYWLDATFKRVDPLVRPGGLLFGKTLYEGDCYHGACDRFGRVIILPDTMTAPTAAWVRK